MERTYAVTTPKNFKLADTRQQARKMADLYRAAGQTPLIRWGRFRASHGVLVQEGMRSMRIPEEA